MHVLCKMFMTFIVLNNKHCCLLGVSRPCGCWTLRVSPRTCMKSFTVSQPTALTNHAITFTTKPTPLSTSELSSTSPSTNPVSTSVIWQTRHASTFACTVCITVTKLYCSSSLFIIKVPFLFHGLNYCSVWSEFQGLSKCEVSYSVIQSIAKSCLVFNCV